MSEQKDDVVDPEYRHAETIDDSNANPETPLAFAACIHAAVCVGGLALLTLYTDTSPRPWFVYIIVLCVPVNAWFATYLGLRFLREK